MGAVQEESGAIIMGPGRVVVARRVGKIELLLGALEEIGAIASIHVENPLWSAAS